MPLPLSGTNHPEHLAVVAAAVAFPEASPSMVVVGAAAVANSPG